MGLTITREVSASATYFITAETKNSFAFKRNQKIAQNLPVNK